MRRAQRTEHTVPPRPVRATTTTTTTSTTTHRCADGRTTTTRTETVSEDTLERTPPPARLDTPLLHRLATQNPNARSRSYLQWEALRAVTGESLSRPLVGASAERQYAALTRIAADLDAGHYPEAPRGLRDEVQQAIDESPYNRLSARLAYHIGHKGGLAATFPLGFVAPLLVGMPATALGLVVAAPVSAVEQGLDWVRGRPQPSSFGALVGARSACSESLYAASAIAGACSPLAPSHANPDVERARTVFRERADRVDAQRFRAPPRSFRDDVMEARDPARDEDDGSRPPRPCES
jgi:hypothetical protein